MSAFTSNPDYAKHIASQLDAKRRLPSQHFSDAPVGASDSLSSQAVAAATATPEEALPEPTLIVPAPTAVAPRETYAQRALHYLNPISGAQEYVNTPGYQNLKKDVLTGANPLHATSQYFESPGGQNLKKDIIAGSNPLHGMEVYRSEENKKEDEAAKYRAKWEPTPVSDDQAVSAPTTASHGGTSDGQFGASSPGVFVPEHEVKRVSGPRQEANEQTYISEAAATHEGALAEAAGHEQMGSELKSLGADMQADLDRSTQERAARAEITRRMLEDAQKAAADVASKKVDPNRLMNNMSTWDHIRMALAMGLGGFAGDHTVANMVQKSIDNDIAAQNSDIENQRHGAESKMSHYSAALKAYGDMDAASQADRVAKYKLAMITLQGMAEQSQEPIVMARAKAAEAEIARKAVDAGIAFNSLIPGQMVGGASNAVGNAEGPVFEVTGQADTAKLEDGREIFIPKGGEDIKKGIRNQQMAIDAARELHKLMTGPRPTYNPLAPQAYREWVGQANFYLKQAALAESGAHGGGAGGALGKLKAEANALDQQSKAGKVLGAAATWWELMMGRDKSLASAANELATKVGPRDLDEMIKSSGAYTGRSVPIPGKKPGDVARPGFLATGKYKSPYADEQKSPSVPQSHPLPVPGQ